MIDPIIIKGSDPQLAPEGLRGAGTVTTQLQPLMQTMSLEEFVALPAGVAVSLRRFGRRTRTIPSDVTLAAATAAVIANNSPDRVALNLLNSGVANPFTVTSDGGKTVAQGDTLDANGGAYQANVLEDGDLPTREFWGISTAGTTVHIEEVIAYGPLVQLPSGVTPL